MASNSDTALLTAALAYGARGWNIFPLKPKSKEPLTRDGFKSATSDPSMIRRWWRDHPTANIGLYLAGSGLLAIDIDPRNDGLATFDDLCTFYGDPGGGALQLSGRGDGGRHLLFLEPGERCVKDLGPGVDVKHKGYILLAPSIHPDTGRPYEWAVQGPPHRLPPAWVARILRPEPRQGNDVELALTEAQVATVGEALRHVKDPDRDTWLRIGMALHAGGFSQDAWDLWAADNGGPYDQDDQNRSWSGFRADRGDAATYRTILKIAMDHGWKNRGEPAQMQFTKFEGGDETERTDTADTVAAATETVDTGSDPAGVGASVTTPSDDTQNAGNRSVTATAGTDSNCAAPGQLLPDHVGRPTPGGADPPDHRVAAQPDVADPVADVARPALVTRVAAELTVRRKTPYTIKGVLPERGIGVIFGHPGTGKTFAALDMAGAVAAGTGWHGHRTSARKVAVVAAENPASIEQRLALLREAGHLAAADDVYVTSAGASPIDLTNVELVNELGTQYRKLGIRFVVVDTLATATPGMDENDAGEMGVAIAAAHSLASACRGFVLIVHHSGKDDSKGARGSSALFAAVDTELRVRKDPGSDDLSIEGTKSRDGQMMDRKWFRLERWRAGCDDEGDPIEAAHLVAGQGPQDHTDTPQKAFEETSPAGTIQNIVWEVVKELERPDGEEEGATAWAVRLDVELETAKRLVWISGKGRNSAINVRTERARRAIEDMMGARLTRVWLVPDGGEPERVRRV